MALDSLARGTLECSLVVRLTEEWLLTLNGKASSVCVHIYMYVCSYTYGPWAHGCVCICAWRPEVDKGNLPSVSPLYSKAGFVTEPRAH